MAYGLDKRELKKIITEKVERNPDLKYYINDDYIYELVEAIVDGVSEAIEKNTKAVFRQLEHELKGRR
jgi:hypothetical protein